MLDTLPTVRWSEFPQPPWNQRDTIPRVLRQLAQFQDAGRNDRIYNDVLFALGNNHRGTMWPVAIAVVPFLVEIVENGPAAAAKCAAEILQDVLLFYPDEGFDTVLGSDGSPVALRDAVLNEVLRFRSQLERSRQVHKERPSLTETLSDLVAHLDDRSSTTDTS